MMREKVQRSHLALAKGKWARQCALLRAIKQVSRKTRPIELAACGCVGSPSSFGRSKTGRGLRRLHFLAEKALIFKHICILGSRSVVIVDVGARRQDSRSADSAAPAGARAHARSPPPSCLRLPLAGALCEALRPPCEC